MKELKDDLCSGCGICESVFGSEKIRISYNDKGFLRPTFKKQLTTEEVSAFREICPGINAKHKTTNNYDVLWGPYLSISSGYATNERIRYKGSSGGVLTSVSSYLLEEKKVECVLHIGSSEIHPYRNEYKVSYSSKDLLNNSGSRYAPSATLVNILEIVKNHSSIAVVGKPCDIKGVRNFIEINDEARTKIKYLLSFMCAGVPSQLGTKKIIENFKIKERDVVSLRYRGEGWPGYFKVKDNKENIYKITYNESWGTVLNKYLQFRCKICADGTGEFADLTCADAWEKSENGYPSFEERKGKSLIISRNEKGLKVIADAISLGYIAISNKNYSSSDIEQMQPYQKQRKQNLIPRLVALKLFGRTVPNYNIKFLLKASLKENPLRLAKNFIGMIKRLL